MKRGKLIYHDGWSFSGRLCFFICINAPWLTMAQQLLTQFKEDPIDLITSLITYNLLFFPITLPWGKHYYLYEHGIACKKLGRCLRFEPYETIEAIEGWKRRRHSRSGSYEYYGLTFWFGDATYMDVQMGSLDNVKKIWTHLITHHPELIKELTYDKPSCTAKEIYQKLIQVKRRGSKDE